MRRAALAVVVACGLVAGAVAYAQKPAAQWDVHVPERLEIAQGAVGELSVGIAVDRGLVVSKDASVIVDLGVPPGVTIKKKRLQRPDAVDPQADAPRFAANVRADTVIPSIGSGMAHWREKLFAQMHHNASGAADFLHLPNNAVVELGSKIEI